MWLSPEWLFFQGVLTNSCALKIEGGVVVEIAAKASLAGADNILPLSGVLSNGLIDLQVNGGGGMLFNTNPTRAGIEAIIKAHRAFGTAWILPTVISDTEAILERAIDAVVTSWGLTGLAGIHIEGPHISLTKRGTHAPEVLRPLGEHTLGLIHRLREHGIPTMITVAPEVVTCEQIAQLTKAGAVVSLGHSDASYEQTCAALKAGARCFTHLFNAMSQLNSRAPGMVGAALTSSAFAGFICDGHHVSDASLKVALSAGKGKERMFLVSDAMPTVGGPETFTLYGKEIRLQGSKLVNREGNLAGAHVVMAQSVARAIKVLGLSVEEALRMGITVPEDVIGSVGKAQLVGSRVDELLQWSDDLAQCQWLRSDLDASPGESRHLA